MEGRQPSDYPPLMDTTMVAEFLQMSSVHVRRLAREGVIPAYRIAGVRAFRFKRDEIIAWFEGQRVNPSEFALDGAEEMADSADSQWS